MRELVHYLGGGSSARLLQYRFLLDVIADRHGGEVRKHLHNLVVHEVERIGSVVSKDPDGAT